MQMHNQFAIDVAQGLTSKPKFLPTKYLYDKRGDAIFQQIMRMEEYYPTDCEFEIFSNEKERLRSIFSLDGSPFQLVEFGAGDGLKTKILLKHFSESGSEFEFLPIDISENVLNQLAEDLSVTLPNLTTRKMHGDYFHVLERLHQKEAEKRKVVLFLGSNIGNFKDDLAHQFLQRIADNFTMEDFLMIGFDLKKDPRTILTAYDDPAGITKEFNLNLLHRINRELNGNFQIDNFEHYATYDPISGATKSFLISKQKQSVKIGDLEASFEKSEPIFTELSQKYGLEDIETLANDTGFEVHENLLDSRQYFVNSIWRLKQGQ